MAKEKTKEICGIVMPISSIDGCDESHWIDVQKVIRDSIESAEMEARLVSDADDIGVIQKRIVQNLYDDPIIVCDVSGKNPNVMFELGMRLAFDKPTIIIKDDQTSYSFDTSPIEHLEYPRDLRFNRIIEFKEKLRGKIQNTLKKARSDQDYTPFLGHYGTFKAVTLDEKEGSVSEVLLEEFRELRLLVGSSLKTARNDRVHRSNGLPSLLGIRSPIEDALRAFEIDNLKQYRLRSHDVYKRVYNDDPKWVEICGDGSQFESTIDRVVEELLVSKH